MTAVALDRRILRAFYTQYVAVLLIILVFFVAAFQSTTFTKSEPTAVSLSSAKSKAFGEVRLSDELLIHGLSSNDKERLLAVAAVLKTHDVTAVVELTVPRMALGEVDNGAIRAASLTEHFDQFFQSHGVSEELVRYEIRDRASERPVGGVVFIHDMGVAHE
jgi:hypothetical protein